MSAEVLKQAEKKAVQPIAANVVGKVPVQKRKKWGAIGARVFVAAIFVILFALVIGGNLTVAGLEESLRTATDVQCADAVESKIIVFQQTLAQGEVPSNTIARLKQKEVLVGFDDNGNFSEAANGNALLVGDKVVSASDFATEIHSNLKLYNALNEATYSCAAYYYDEAAAEVFEEIGTNRNNFANSEASFEEIMTEKMGEGSEITVNGVTMRAVKDEESGEISYVYETTGGKATSGDGAAFVSAVRENSLGSSDTEAALMTAESLSVAETAVREQRSSLFYLLFMENVGMVKVGDGGESRINEMMNVLYRDVETEVVDVETGEVVTVRGSMMDAPSLSAVLSGRGVNAASVVNYSNERVLKTVEKRVAANATDDVVSGTVTSAKGTNGTISRMASGSSVADAASVEAVVPTVISSLSNNGFSTLTGVNGGEFLVEGAVNVGRKLAQKSGATAGDAAAVQSYARLTSDVLALEAASDRMNRSPLDVSSPNTWLGSIVRKLARMGGSWGQLLKNSLSTLATAQADGGESAYLTSFGDCTNLNNIGAVGSAGCSTVATFDTSTLGDIYNDAGFVQFVQENTEIVNGVRKVKAGSALARFILYNDERTTPLGVTDGGILTSLQNESSSIPLISDFVTLVQQLLGANEADLKIASGEAFVNSAENLDWQTYKYAQRYVALARALESLRQYDGEETAYAGILYFEGTENPVVAFKRDYLALQR